ncbi:hypothetical protein Zmor_021053 [Zophobas morio]|uniref:Uncharacterized protein n=1 Tax=Zophobas morio TaxID=2755281 RepID=A0AA38I3D1_9CUCU|nr:hypothetical protein Zmor_020255 [Zophobas morio]KAJ3649302.1 hypothetical protein Zmor_021053 [Zophobas morio]
MTTPLPFRIYYFLPHNSYPPVRIAHPCSFIISPTPEVIASSESNIDPQVGGGGGGGVLANNRSCPCRCRLFIESWARDLVPESSGVHSGGGVGSDF